MMREKIEGILKYTNVSAEEIDALLAAIGEGPVYQHRMYSGGWGDVDKAHHGIAPAHMRRTLYTAPQPAPDVAALQARIAELERQVSRELEAIGDAIKAALDTCPATEVLQVVTGAFVGLTVEMVRRQVGPEALEKPIQIDGCGNRNITIHPVEQPAANQKGEQQ